MVDSAAEGRNSMSLCPFIQFFSLCISLFVLFVGADFSFMFIFFCCFICVSISSCLSFKNNVGLLAVFSCSFANFLLSFPMSVVSSILCSFSNEGAAGFEKRS